MTLKMKLDFGKWAYQYPLLRKAEIYKDIFFPRLLEHFPDPLISSAESAEDSIVVRLTILFRKPGPSIGE